MIAANLVQLIESHADQLADAAMDAFQTSDKCSDLHKVPPDELRQRSQEIYRNLSDWLLAKTEKEIEARYREIGARRAQQGVAFSHFVYALTATKATLYKFLHRQGMDDSALGVFGHFELFKKLDTFFDRALYYASVGYEQANGRKAA